MEERIVGAATVITVRGRFGVSADPNLADDFQGRVDRAVGRGRSRVVLDLAGVSYVDSMGWARSSVPITGCVSIAEF